MPHYCVSFLLDSLCMMIILRSLYSGPELENWDYDGTYLLNHRWTDTDNTDMDI